MNPQRENRRMLLRLGGAAGGMFGFGFALVPFYRAICEIAGINDLQRADARARDPANTQVDRSRSITLELDANTHAMPWRFRPLLPRVSIHPGALVRVDYEIENTLDRSLTGQAIPSYGPRTAAAHVRKLECFCFRRQTLAARERRVMPVVFVLDAGLPVDIPTITLSYTFFEVAGGPTA